MKDNVSTQIRLPANLHAWMKQEAKRIRTQSVMEIKVAKDPDYLDITKEANVIRFLINIPTALRDELRTIAKAQGSTLNGLIRQILWDWIEGRK